MERRYALSQPTLDVIAVQSAGLRKADDGTYAPTLYSDADDFGMLGGYVRVLAATELYRQNPNTPFVFCNGRSAKQIAKFGPDVPTDAEIYAAAFKKAITQPNAKPEVLLENTSVNTVASIANLLDMCAAHGWKHMGLVSSEYHIPRIRALCGLMFKKLGDEPVKITYISAEEILKQQCPGMYDAEIDAAYKTPIALARIRNEQNGLQDIASGQYQIGEFQLSPNHRL